MPAVAPNPPAPGQVIKVHRFAASCARCPALGPLADSITAARTAAMAAGWATRYALGLVCSDCKTMKKERR